MRITPENNATGRKFMENACEEWTVSAWTNRDFTDTLSIGMDSVARKRGLLVVNSSCVTEHDYDSRTAKRVLRERRKDRSRGWYFVRRAPRRSIRALGPKRRRENNDDSHDRRPAATRLRLCRSSRVPHQ